MIGSLTKDIQIHQIRAKSLESNISLEMQVRKIDREKRLALKNPKYTEIIAKYNHLRGVEMIDKDEKAEMPVHLVISVNEYTRIKTETPPRIGRPGKAIASLAGR
jgi:hypothetical protein